MEAFNDATCPKCVYQGHPFITFYLKHGKVAINGVGCKMMDLKVGSMVEFYRKEIDGASEWYLAPVHADGFKLSKHTGSNTLVFTRKELVISLFNSLFYEGDRARAYILRKRRVEDKWVYKLDTSELKNK